MNANRHGRFQGRVVRACTRQRNGSWRLVLADGATVLVAPDRSTFEYV